MNLEFYRIIGETLTEGIDKAYKAGLASVVKLNKKEILRLKNDNDPELFKINYTGTDYMMLQNFKVEAFTIAGVQSYELEEILKKLALDLQEGKHPLAKGEKDIKELWTVEAQNLISEYVPVQDMPPPNQLNTNLRTAMQSSYHAAQYNRLQDESVRDLYPAYQYKTLADARVREEHRKLHDRIWSSSDEIWHRIWPPNGWNCRCYVKPLNQDEASNSAVEPLTTSDEARHDIVKEGKIGKDFDRNPGVVRSIWGKWLQTKLTGKNYESISNEIVNAGYSMPKWELIEPLLKEVAEIMPEPIELTMDNFEKLFGRLPGSINTMLGKFSFGDAFFQKLSREERKNSLSLIKPTLENPHFVFVDKDNGTLFVKAFKAEGGELNYAGILKQVDGEDLFISFYDKKNLKNKVNEGKFLLYQAFIRASGNADAFKKFTHDAGRVNFNTKLGLFADIKNIKITADNLNENEIKNIMLSANEIWGETYNYNGVVNSELNFIRYRVDGFQFIKVNNNEAYKTGFTGYDKINDFRKGVIIPNG